MALNSLFKLRRRARMGAQVSAVAAIFFVLIISVLIGYYAGVGNSQARTPLNTTLSFNLPSTTNQSNELRVGVTDPTSTVYTTIYVITTITNSSGVYTVTVTNYYTNTTYVVVTTTNYPNNNASLVYLTTLKTLTVNNTVTSVTTVTVNNTVTTTSPSPPPSPPPPPHKKANQ